MYHVLHYQEQFHLVVQTAKLAVFGDSNISPSKRKYSINLVPTELQLVQLQE